MNSAVQTLLNGGTPERAHGRAGYRSWCACCTPQDLTSPGKPQRRTPQHPQLAWRSRNPVVRAMKDGGGDGL
jgi:hypothetical protein